jgi:hypothetical protein
VGKGDLVSKTSEESEPWLPSQPLEQSRESSFANRVVTSTPSHRPGEHAGAFVDRPLAEKNHKSAISVNIGHDYVEIFTSKNPCLTKLMIF